MIAFASFLLGGIFGIGLWLYVSGFIERLQADIYNTYTELFPQNSSSLQPHFATLQTKKCGHILWYFFTVGLFFSLLNTLLSEWLLALWLGATLMLLWAIAYLDWHYQLISPTPCLWLTALGFFGAEHAFTSLSLQTSLQSAVVFFIIFYSIYWIAKLHYKKEAFGQGDYWLALGIGSYLPLETFPQFILIACVSGILFAFLFRKTKDFLPFAPFMCLSLLVVWFKNSYG